jgi:hypothetical protein
MFWIGLVVGFLVGGILMFLTMLFCAIARENRHMSELDRYELSCQRFAAAAMRFGEARAKEQEEATKKRAEAVEAHGEKATSGSADGNGSGGVKS